MSDRRFEERLAELEAEAAESEANAAKWAQESIDFESELKRTKDRLAEAEKERDVLSARVRELEGALGPVIDRRSMLVDEPLVVTLCLTRDEYARAARALKGEG